MGSEGEEAPEVSAVNHVSQLDHQRSRYSTPNKPNWITDDPPSKMCSVPGSPVIPADIT